MVGDGLKIYILRDIYLQHLYKFVKIYYAQRVYCVFLVGVSLWHLI